MIMTTIDRRLNSHNCEWLCRPHTAVSELSDSLYQNMQIMEKSPLLQQDKLQELLSRLKLLFRCEMDPETIIKVVHDAVQDAIKSATSTLVNVSFMEDLINKLKIEIQDSFNLKLDKAIKPLECKIQALEAKAEVHEAHMKNLEE